MGIDWEYLLDAEGDELQDRYDDICGDPDWFEDRWEDDPWQDGEDCEEDEPGPALQGLLGTCAAGEAVLASNAMVRNFHLRLFRDLSYTPSEAVGKRHLDYLLATESEAVLGIVLADEARAQDPGGIPTAYLPREDMEQGRVNAVLNQLAPLLAPLTRGEPLDTAQPCFTAPVPMGLHSKMAKLRMLRRRQAHLWETTPYGCSLGLLDGYLTPRGQDRPLHTFFILSHRKDDFEEALGWDQAYLDAVRPQPLRPWEELLERAGQGLPCSSIHAANVVQAFGAMPFDEYMAPCPNGYERLRAEVGEARTYQEAADRLFRLCMELEQTNENRERCMNLIYALIRPLYLAMATMQPPIA